MELKADPVLGLDLRIYASYDILGETIAHPQLLAIDGGVFEL